MKEVEVEVPLPNQATILATIMLRLVIALNFVRFVLSFVPWFEGTADTAGYADRLFNPNHTDGFRSDFLWLIASSAFIFVSLFWSIQDFKENRSARINVYLSLAWLAAFSIYIGRVVVTGTLWFG